MKDLLTYLKDNWEQCVRENHSDSGDLIGLPYKYTIPSPNFFDELYYWDTYFTNIGLLDIGKAELAKNNVDNMLYLVDKFGYMPNGNRTYYLTRSQPPFLSEMVKDIYIHYGDERWLESAYTTLTKEYRFWMENRILPIGLNHYDAKIKKDEIASYKDEFIQRSGIYPPLDDYSIVHHYLSVCESGWDLNPRFDLDAYNFAAVDLNSILYLFERNMEFFASVLSKETDLSYWISRAENRKKLMNKYLLDKNNIFLDYNYKTERKSKFFSVASYYTMFAKVANTKQAECLHNSLKYLEEEYGISSCEKTNSDTRYQWDYPNGWACLQYIVIVGLDNYGYTEDALRIAKKYTKLVEKNFLSTKNFWEKYNVVKGCVDIKSEYQTPTMFGWSAGVYVFTKKYIDEHINYS